MIVFKHDESNDEYWENYEEFIKWVYEPDAEKKISNIELMAEFHFGTKKEDNE